MSEQGLSVDPLWPRAGAWPRLGGDGASTSTGGFGESGGTGSGTADVDLTLIGIPTHETSLSPTGAHATPAAVREALRRYSTFVPGLDVESLRFADAGDVPSPDGDEGRERAVRAVAEAVRRSRLTVAIGGDNSLTVPVALGAAD